MIRISAKISEYNKYFNEICYFNIKFLKFFNNKQNN